MKTSPAALYVFVRLIRPLARRLTAAIEAGLDGTGIGVPMRGLLERIYEGGPQSVPQLARGLAVRRQVAQRMVDEGLAEGLLERRDNVAHRRSSLIALTESGRTAIAGILAREEALLAELVDRFDADDVEAATRVLLTLRAAVGTRGEGWRATADGPPPRR